MCEWGGALCSSPELCGEDWMVGCVCVCVWLSILLYMDRDSHTHTITQNWGVFLLFLFFVQKYTIFPHWIPEFVWCFCPNWINEDNPDAKGATGVRFSHEGQTNAQRAERRDETHGDGGRWRFGRIDFRFATKKSVSVELKKNEVLSLKFETARKTSRSVEVPFGSTTRWRLMIVEVRERERAATRIKPSCVVVNWNSLGLCSLAWIESMTVNDDGCTKSLFVAAGSPLMKIIHWTWIAERYFTRFLRLCLNFWNRKV